MKKSTLCLFALSAMMLGTAAFSQDTVKNSSKMSKTTTHKMVKHHHKVVKKMKPVM